MIDEKTIMAAIDTAKKYFSSPKCLDKAQACFLMGIKWYLDNLWRIADEEEPTPSPKDENTIWLLAITKENEVKVMYSTHEVEYEGDEEGYWILHDKEGNEYNPFMGEVKKWLYIDDLLKGGK